MWVDLTLRQPFIEGIFPYTLCCCHRPARSHWSTIISPPLWLPVTITLFWAQPDPSKINTYIYIITAREWDETLLGLWLVWVLLFSLSRQIDIDVVLEHGMEPLHESTGLCWWTMVEHVREIWPQELCEWIKVEKAIVPAVRKWSGSDCSYFTVQKFSSSRETAQKKKSQTNFMSSQGWYIETNNHPHSPSHLRAI